jgi:hypothetical protein
VTHTSPVSAGPSSFGLMVSSTVNSNGSSKNLSPASWEAQVARAAVGEDHCTTGLSALLDEITIGLWWEAAQWEARSWRERIRTSSPTEWMIRTERLRAWGGIPVVVLISDETSGESPFH